MVFLPLFLPFSPPPCLHSRITVEIKQYNFSNGWLILAKYLDNNFICTVIMVVKYLVILSSSCLNVKIMLDTYFKKKI